MSRKPVPRLGDAELRDLAEQHYDGRRQRLEAYAAWLEAALAIMAARPGGSAHLVRLASQLAIVRQEAWLAARPRIPRKRPAPPLENVLPSDWCPGRIGRRPLAPRR